nr:aminopeptidase [Bacilli bacterium]
MKDLQEKYARVILESCLGVEKNQPLFISCLAERNDFVEIVTKVAKEHGITDIYYDIVDSYLKHDLLKNKKIDELKTLPYWNKDAWNTYAEKGAAFLMLAAEMPGLMSDIDPKKVTEMTKYLYSTRKRFEELRDKAIVPWCIAAVPTELWAKELFKDSANPVDELWNKIFKICSIDKDNPVKIWNDKTKLLSERAKKLTNYHFKTLRYSNSKGTDFKVSLPKEAIWESGYSTLATGKKVLVNFPTEEVFTSPDCMSAEGIVYSSKPLSYQSTIIDNFNITFKAGKAIDCHAEKGSDVLKEMINICENSNMLGEVALVPYDSPISNSKQVFLETLFDENASCHLALGDSFTECIENGINIDKDTLFNEYHLNKCDSHVDFMVGTEDLNITGVTYDGKEIPIFINGNFTEEFN